MHACMERVFACLSDSLACAFLNDRLRRPKDWDTINVDWFTNKKEENIPLPEYKLNFIWTERNIAVAVDQVYSRVSSFSNRFKISRKPLLSVLLIL